LAQGNIFLKEGHYSKDATWIMKDEEQGLLHPDGSRERRYVFQWLLISAGPAADSACH
jgi:hypothetical protein